jgi:ribosomal protein S11
VSPGSVATWSTEGAVGAVQSAGASTPYAIREATGSLVCQAIVAPVEDIAS